MKLLVARHAECVANMLGIVAGSRDDSPLTEHGWHEARMLAERIGTFDGLFVSSPLIRAYDTALEVRDMIAPKKEIRVDPDFIEIDVGDALGMPIEEYFVLEKTNEPIRNTETPEEIFTRVTRGLETLKRTSSNTDTLLITHSGTYRMIECLLRGMPYHLYKTIPGLQNGELRTFEL